MDQRADARHHQGHRHRQGINQEGDVYLERTDGNPMPEQLNHAALLGRPRPEAGKEAHGHDKRQANGRRAKPAGRFAQTPADQQVDQRAQQRKNEKKPGKIEHRTLNPNSQIQNPTRFNIWPFIRPTGGDLLQSNRITTPGPRRGIHAHSAASPVPPTSHAHAPHGPPNAAATRSARCGDDPARRRRTAPASPNHRSAAKVRPRRPPGRAPRSR